MRLIRTSYRRRSAVKSLGNLRRQSSRQPSASSLDPADCAPPSDLSFGAVSSPLPPRSRSLQSDSGLPSNILPSYQQGTTPIAFRLCSSRPRRILHAFIPDHETHPHTQTQRAPKLLPSQPLSSASAANVLLLCHFGMLQLAITRKYTTIRWVVRQPVITHIDAQASYPTAQIGGCGRAGGERPIDTAPSST